jgi:hypothetical protein
VIRQQLINFKNISWWIYCIKTRFLVVSYNWQLGLGQCRWYYTLNYM